MAESGELFCDLNYRRQLGKEFFRYEISFIQEEKQKKTLFLFIYTYLRKFSLMKHESKLFLYILLRILFDGKYIFNC